MPSPALSFAKPLFHLKHFPSKTLLLFLAFTIVQQINAIHLSSSISKDSKGLQPILENQRQLIKTKTIPLPPPLSSIPSPVLSFHQATPPPLFIDQDDKYSWHFPQVHDIIADVPASLSRHLSEKAQSVGNVSTLAGIAKVSGSTNGMGTNSQFATLFAVSISPDGLFALVTDSGNQLIRQITLSTASVSTLAGVAGVSGAANGIGTNSQFNGPVGICISPDGLFALMTDWKNHLIRHIILSTASVSTLAGVAGSIGATNGIGTNSQFRNPFGVSISPDGLFALICDSWNHLIRHIILSTASVSTLAGVARVSGATNGMGTNSRFNNPRGVSISPDGIFAFVADWYNHLIRHIILSTASVSTLAGVARVSGAANGMGTNSQFNASVGVSISPDGLFVLVTDRENHLIRQIILSTASVSTLAGVTRVSGAANGRGTNSQFNCPVGVSISRDGLFALIVDQCNYLIRQIILSTASPFSPPSASPTIPIVTVFSFGVKIGDEGMLSSGKAILVEYLRNKRGDLIPPHLSPHPSFSSVSGKMVPISGLVNAAEVSSASDPPLSSDSILIKWRPVSAVSGIGSWEPSNHTILSIPVGGVLVSWLVSLLSEEIKGFVVKSECDLCSCFLSFPHHCTLLSSLLLVPQIPCPPPISSTSLTIPL
jgi:hypothetical protein